MVSAINDSALSAVVVHYGPPEPTVRVANKATTWADQVLVVVNDLSARPPDLDPTVQWLLPERNLGYGAALSFASDVIRTPLFVALNNDIVLSTRTVDDCVAQFREPDVGIVGPVLLDSHDRLQSGAGYLTKVLWRPRADRPVAGPAMDVAWITGAIMFARTSLLETPGLDGTYFLGCEDVDFCLRSWSVGFRVRVVASQPAIHLGAQVISGPRWNYYVVRNHVWLALSHFGIGVAVGTWFYYLLMLLRILAADSIKRRNWQSSRLAFWGLLHSLRPKPHFARLPLPDEPIPARWMTW